MAKTLFTIFILLIILTVAHGLSSYAKDGRRGSTLGRALTAVETVAVKNAFREIPSARNIPETIYAPWLRVVEIEVNTGLGSCLEPFTAQNTAIHSFVIRFQPYTLLGTPHPFHYVTTCRGNRVIDGLARENDESLREIASRPF